MATDFATLQTRVNASVGRVLHTDAALLNGVAVTGRFDNGFDMAIGMAASAPMYTLPTAAVPTPVIDLPLVIGSVTYKVLESQPDGTGITTLILEVSA